MCGAVTDRGHELLTGHFDAAWLRNLCGRIHGCMSAQMKITCDGRKHKFMSFQNEGVVTRLLPLCLPRSWVLFEEPDFCGEAYIVERGLYGCPEDWGALLPKVASAMPVVLVRAVTHTKLPNFVVLLRWRNDHGPSR